MFLLHDHVRESDHGNKVNALERLTCSLSSDDARCWTLADISVCCCAESLMHGAITERRPGQRSEQRTCCHRTMKVRTQAHLQTSTHRPSRTHRQKDATHRHTSLVQSKQEDVNNFTPSLHHMPQTMTETHTLHRKDRTQPIPPHTSPHYSTKYQ